MLASLQRGFQPDTLKLGPQFANPEYKHGRDSRNLLNSTVFLALAIIVMVIVLGWALFRAGVRIKNLPQQEV